MMQIRTGGSNYQHFRNLWTVWVFFALWVVMWAMPDITRKIKDVKDNYTDLHKRVQELERRVYGQL